jgi:valyl-tRNA synthetase
MLFEFFKFSFSQRSCGHNSFRSLCLWLLIQDVNLSTERLTSNKGFTNKLWDPGKSILLNLTALSDASAWEHIREHKEGMWDIQFQQVC